MFKRASRMHQENCLSINVHGLLKLTRNSRVNFAPGSVKHK